MSSLLREDNEYINKLSRDILDSALDGENQLDLENIRSLDNPLKSRIIIEYAKSVTQSNSLETVHIEAILSLLEKSGKINLPDNWVALIKGGKLKIQKGNTAQILTHYTVNITETEENILKTNQNVNNLFLKNSIDCDKIVGEYSLRTRISGDKVRLKNRGCTKTLTKLYNEYNIPIEEREILPVIADESGVIWIHGIGVAHRCAISEKSKRILLISSEKE